jgi:hypothetical protein
VEAVDIRLVILLLVGMVVVAVGVLFRRARARQLPDVSEDLFLERFHRHHEGARDHVLAERRRVASSLGIPVGKLLPEQTLDELSRRFGFLAEFSVAVNDLYDEAAEIRQLAGLAERDSPPDTIEELVEDLAKGREILSSTAVGRGAS